MARPKNPNPKHGRQKTRGGDRGYVILSGERLYTGPVGSWGTQQATDTYTRLLAEWIARGRTPGGAANATPAAGTPAGFVPSVSNPGAGCSLKSLIAAYWIHCKTRYTRHDGIARRELDNIRVALKWLKRLYADHRAADFTIDQLCIVRRDMIGAGLCRNYINRHVSRMVAAFKWGMLKGLVPPTVHHALSQIPQLEKDEDGVRESEAVPPVPGGQISAVLAKLPPPVRAMVELQVLTAARPGELRGLRTRDVDRSDPAAWAAWLRDHKTAHKGKKRAIFFGPKAQAILAPYLNDDAPDAYCFSPAAAEAQRNAAKREGRETPMTPSHQRRASMAKRQGRKRPPGAFYTKDSYRNAIQRACMSVFKMPKELRKRLPKPPPDATPAQAEARNKAETDRREKASRWREQFAWSPNQLRHNAATYLEKRYGLEPASKVLGHDKPDTTRIYALRDFDRAKQIMAEVG